VRSYGLKIGFRVNRPDLLSRVETILPPGAERHDFETVEQLYSLYSPLAPRPGMRQFHLAYAAGLRIARTLDLDEAVAELDGYLRLYVAAYARRRIFVHAGVVGWRGGAILLPGRSLAGKSTLVAALVRAGATYYSDEYAVLDERGRVHPYARPLALRADRGARAQPVEVGALGGTAGTDPLPVRLVVTTHFAEGARFRPRSQSSGQLMLALLDNTVPARHAAARSLHTLRAVAGSAVGLQGKRGEAEAAASRLLEIADRFERTGGPREPTE
jgi:hypothetical protein